MNHYLDYAERVLTVHDKRRMRRAETRAQRAREKELRERDELLVLWRKHHRAQRDALLAGQYGVVAQELVASIETMTLDDGAALIDRVVAGPWRSADADTRFVVLQLIDDVLARVRERNGLPPFDDALPFSDEPDTVFQIIRRELSCD
jgi:hypothetical protein